MKKVFLILLLCFPILFGCKKKTDPIPAQPAKMEGNKLISFDITSNKEIASTIDSTYSIIYLVIPHDITPSAEMFYAKFSPNASLSSDAYGAGIDFTSPKVFTVTSESGKERKYTTKNIESEFSVELTTIFNFKNTNNPADYTRYTDIYSTNKYTWEGRKASITSKPGSFSLLKYKQKNITSVNIIFELIKEGDIGTNEIKIGKYYCSRLLKDYGAQIYFNYTNGYEGVGLTGEIEITMVDKSSQTISGTYNLSYIYKPDDYEPGVELKGDFKNIPYK